MKHLKTFIFSTLIMVLLCTTACKGGSPSGESVDAVEASTMRLVRTEGTVSVTDENEEAIQLQIDMRLFSGNAVATETKSRAGISLDDTKTVTLGEVSLARLFQKEKVLSLNLEKGELYFNVTKPLDDDESFDISTSNMTLGIRGTTGYVSALDETSVRIIFATGQAVITASDGKTQEIEGGQEVILTMKDSASTFTVQPIFPKDYPELLVEGIKADGITPVEPETALPEDGDRIVVVGTLRQYGYEEMVELQGEPDPNAASANLNDTYNILVLDTPQRMTLKSGDGMGSWEGEVRMFKIFGDPPAMGHHIYSINPERTSWASDTSMPLGQPHTSDIYVLD